MENDKDKMLKGLSLRRSEATGKERPTTFQERKMGKPWFYSFM
ncbi:MAG: hypothetical protein ABIJ80_03285 [Patescibacteria group bacterium]